LVFLAVLVNIPILGNVYEFGNNFGYPNIAHYRS